MAKKLIRDGGVDRISYLPDILLCYILSFLPTKEAVSTSILSTKWRYLYAYVPNFVLDDGFLLQPNKHATLGKNYLDFVDRLLASHTATNIEKLVLIIRRDSSRVENWIAAAFQRGVQQLALCILIKGFRFSSNLPDILFSGKTLVALKLILEKRTVLHVPTHVNMPSLKTLHLRCIEFLDDDSFQRLFSSCIFLEDLIVRYCRLINVTWLKICHPFLKRLTIINLFSLPYNYFGIMIDAPSLVYLEYEDYIAAAYSLVNLHSLVTADIGFFRKKFAWQDISPATEFFRGIANVKALRLCITLEVLNELSVTSLPEQDPSLFWSKCETILIIGSSFGSVEFQNITYLLERATVLEKLTIGTMSNIDQEEKLRIAITLSASARELKKKCSVRVV